MMDGLPSICAGCGQLLKIEIKRVGPKFAVVEQCCGAEQIISDRLELSDYHKLEEHYKELRRSKYNRRKRERRNK
jgi:hypothetical protein